MEPACGELHLWLCRADLLDPVSAAALERRWLSPEESDRIARFACGRARDRYRTSRLLLRRLLAHYTGAGHPAALRIALDPGGKPRLESGRIGFNLSHSRHRVAIGVVRRDDVGVDVEDESALPSDPGDGFYGVATAFDEEDRARLATLPTGDRRSEILRLWTLKEAIAKATGRGLALPLRAAKIPLRGATPFPCAVAGSQGPWSLTCMPLAGGSWLSAALPGCDGGTRVICPTAFPFASVRSLIRNASLRPRTATGLPTIQQH